MTVVVAEPKTRQGSSTPTDGRPFSRLGSASGQVQLSPHERLDCNPSFWAWVHSQGVASLDSLEAVQKWHAAWQQEGCPAPPTSITNPPTYSAPGTLNSSVHSNTSSAMMHGQLADDNVRYVLPTSLLCWRPAA